jgi:hydrogenase expression/formation protein HypE
MTANSTFQCPINNDSKEVIKLGHGSGGKMTAQLIEQLFLPKLGNEFLNSLDDATLFKSGSKNLAITTDSYVVKPIFFPGGNIGSLAVYGTVNDLCMRGAKPLYLTASFILEEGFAISELDIIVESMSKACEIAGVKIIAADTKVVNSGAADKIYINTTGIGLVELDVVPSCHRAAAGDAIIVSGDLGCHGMAVMCSREGLELETSLLSDCAPLNSLVEAMVNTKADIHCLRDLTRGGLASATNEIAQASKVGIELDESAIPINSQVKASCELLGLDPLYVACEGRLIAIVKETDCEKIIYAMRNQNSDPIVIGRVTDDHKGTVVSRSRVGGRRIVDKLSGEQLPRIC